MRTTTRKHAPVQDSVKTASPVVSGGAPSFSIPNSAMASMLGYRDSPGDAGDLAAAMQAKMNAFFPQIPAAEAEAERLSAGVTASSPEAVKDVMGAKLGADFSGVRFHHDAASAARAEAMGALAWTQGNDVYFGADGFTPSVAAHELTHTVQQGAAEGQVSQSAPFGAVQMVPKTRPWQMTQKQLEENRYNPGNSRNLKKKLAELDKATTVPALLRVFANVNGQKNLNAYTASPTQNYTTTTDADVTDVDVEKFRAKMKNMTRMIHDFPELTDVLGGFVFNTTDFYTKNGIVMSSGRTFADDGGRTRAMLDYNPIFDSKTRRIPESPSTWSAASRDYTGNHELSHVLNAELIRTSNPMPKDLDLTTATPAELQDNADKRNAVGVQRNNDWKNGTTANKIVQAALLNTLSLPNGTELDIRSLGQDYTSEYGSSDVREMFAEAFKDVYAHGENARPVSIAIVQEYENTDFHQRKMTKWEKRQAAKARKKNAAVQKQRQQAILSRLNTRPTN